MSEDIYLEKSLMRGWRFLSGDVSFTEYWGKWFKHIEDNIYHVIELINMHEATGEEDQDKYHVSLQEINLDVVDIDSALSCMGFPEDQDFSDSLLLVESVSSYGSYAPMGEYSSNNYRKLLLEAKAESKRLTDWEYHYDQMNLPVNRLGSTAYEYMAGDLKSAMIRGIASGDPAARIIGKIHGLSEDDLNSVDKSLEDFTLNPYTE